MSSRSCERCEGSVRRRSTTSHRPRSSRCPGSSLSSPRSSQPSERRRYSSRSATSTRTIRFYQASSSEIFGDPVETPQTERTPLSPLTPYGVAKAYAHFITRSYRRRYGLYACAGILYNHESPRRPLEFVPVKVANAVASIKLGLSTDLWLGDLTSQRDWGYAGDYVRAMWLMLQQEEPDDYVIATGGCTRVEELVTCAFDHAGLDWRRYVHIDESLKRGKAELHGLVGDPSEARDRLGWSPEVSFEELVAMLVDAELERLAREPQREESSR